MLGRTYRENAFTETLNDVCLSVCLPNVIYLAQFFVYYKFFYVKYTYYLLRIWNRLFIRLNNLKDSKWHLFWVVRRSFRNSQFTLCYVKLLMLGSKFTLFCVKLLTLVIEFKLCFVKLLRLCVEFTFVYFPRFFCIPISFVFLGLAFLVTFITKRTVLSPFI